MELKTYLSSPLVLVSPSKGELLTLYLAVSDFSTSATLVREQDKVQQPTIAASSERSGGKISKYGEASPSVGNYIQKAPTLLPSSYHRSPN